MNKYYLLLLLFNFLYFTQDSSQAIAQSGQISTATSPEVQKETVRQEKSEDPMPRPFIEGNSRENRENLNLQLSLGPGIEMGIPIFSYTIGYYLKPDAVLTARYSERHDYTGDTGRKGLTAIKAGYKKFAGNSFYYQPAVYFRNTSHITSAHYKYEDVGLGLRIGNEWQWENFMLGIDWIGINHSLFEVNEEIHPNVPVPNNIDVDEKFSFDFIGLYLGYSF